MKGIRLSLGLIFLLFFSCGDKADSNAAETVQEHLTLSPTPIFSDSIRYAVVTEPYAKLLEGIEEAHRLVLTCRRGDVLEVHKRQYNEELNQLWLQVSYQDRSGWIPEAHILLFDNREQAETASRDM